MAARAPSLSVFEAADFSGGLNLRDAPSQLGPADTPDCMNFTLDERGGIDMRLGLNRVNEDALAGVVKQHHVSRALGVDVVQIGATLYKTSDWVTVTSFATFTTSERCALVDFNGKVVAVHPADGVFDYDGAAWTLRNATVTGTAIAVWQNKLWVVGTGLRVWWSNAGSSATWTTASDFNDVREVDDEPLVAVGNGQGMDVLGRDGLLVYKADSTYRINDSDDGSYTTVDAAVGCAGPNALVTLEGITLVFHRTGLYACNGESMVRVAEKIEPLFHKDQMNHEALDVVAAGVYENRAVFSFPFGNSAVVNTLTIEFHPSVGWAVPHDFGAATFAVDTEGRLLSASPTAAYMRETFAGGDDEGADITARFQTRWFILEAGYNCQIQRARVAGSGAIDLYVRADFETGQGELHEIDFGGDGFTWNQFQWNDGSLWGPSSYEEYQDVWALGPAKAVSFVIEKTSDDTRTAPALLRTGSAPVRGACAVYSFLIEYVRLGLS